MATIFVNGIDVGKTPTSHSLRRGRTHLLEIKLEGYNTCKIATTDKLNGWLFGNCHCGGLLGIIIDLATGNAYDVDPDNKNVTLTKGTVEVKSRIMETVKRLTLLDERGNKIGVVNSNWQ